MLQRIKTALLYLKMLFRTIPYKLVRQNHLAIEILRSRYFQKDDKLGLERLDHLESENLRLCFIFLPEGKSSPKDLAELKGIHTEVRQRFLEIFPNKDFNWTFGPSGIRDPEVQ